MDGHKYSDCYLAPIAQTSVVANTTCMMKTGDYVDLVQARSVISILYCTIFGVATSCIFSCWESSVFFYKYDIQARK
jgi:hypothetical protein